MCQQSFWVTPSSPLSPPKFLRTGVCALGAGISSRICIMCFGSALLHFESVICTAGGNKLCPSLLSLLVAAKIMFILLWVGFFQRGSIQRCRWMGSSEGDSKLSLRVLLAAPGFQGSQLNRFAGKAPFPCVRLWSNMQIRQFYPLQFSLPIITISAA